MYRGAKTNQTVWVAHNGILEPATFIAYFKTRKTLVYPNMAYCKLHSSNTIQTYRITDLRKHNSENNRKEN